MNTYRHISLGFLFLLASAVITAQSSAPSAAAPSVTVGILREDAVLMPLARFNGRVWRHTWPDTVSAGEVQDFPPLASVPRSWWAGGGPALNWELVKRDGTRQRVRVTRTTWYEGGYADNVGLLTNYVTSLNLAADASDQERRIFAGVVATLPALLTPIAEITDSSPDVQTIRGLLPRLFDSVEPEVWSDRPAAFASPRGKLPSSYDLVSVHAGSLPHGRKLFVVKARHDLGNTGVTAFTAWVSREGTAALKLLDIQGEASDGDGKGETNLIPLSSTTLGSRTFWIAASCGYEGGGYVVLDVTSGAPKVVAEMDAGFCL